VLLANTVEQAGRALLDGADGARCEE